MYCYRYCATRVLLLTLLALLAWPSASNADHHGRAPKSTISLHQSAQSATSDEESFTPLYGAGGLFPPDVPVGREPVFAPSLPIAEKQVSPSRSSGLRADIDATSASERGEAQSAGRSQQAPASDLERHPAAQKIYPTFFRNIPPLGHSRPYYQSTEAAIEQRFNKLRAGVAAAPVLPEGPASPLLGSGDFGVIKGGTFYYDTDVPGKGFVDDFYGLGYNNNNGHGRPQLAFLVQQKPHQKEEQFSNFRDFADINISNDPAYSQHAPRYVGAPTAGHSPESPGALSPAKTTDGGDGSSPTVLPRHEPENILDELRSLDQEGALAGADKGRGKVKKSTLVDRKKRPKGQGAIVALGGRKPTPTSTSDDYMLAAS